MSIVTEGERIVLVESFVDDFDDPLELANTEQGPYVTILDENKDTVLEAIAIPDINGAPGDWSATITIPIMGLERRSEFVAVFKFKTAEGDVHKTKQSFHVDPSQETRETDIVMVIGRDKRIEFSLPVEYVPPIAAIPANISTSTPAQPAIPGDSLLLSLYMNNTPLYGVDGLLASDTTSGVNVTPHIGKTTIQAPAIVGRNQLEPMALLVDYKTPQQSLPKTFTFKVWAVTPSILVAASQLEDFINKAHAKNVIPELAYTQADLIQYLHRGLALLNSFPPQLSSFTGMNMQGMILDGWLMCSSYYALASQLQAEGAMAFDFSGQSVSLNVDRTPAIESALGRVESALSDRLKPMKQLLAKAGATSGDGSIGGQVINGSTNLGTLGVINAPTTRVFYGGQRGSWAQQLV